MTFLTMTRGDTAPIQVTITNLTSAGLTGATFWFTAKYRKTDLDSAAAIQKLNAAFTVVTNGNATTPGVIVVSLAPADTTSLPEYTQLLSWDVQMKDASGNIYTVDSGTLRINADITQATS